MFVALMNVRDEVNILPFTLGHLLYTVRVDRLLVADNGSTDGTRSTIAKAAKLDRRVQWTDASGPWNPQGTINGLAEDAHRSGAKWLLPTDADEFHWLNLPLHALDVAGVGAWELQVTNFAQLGHVNRETSRSLQTMYFRVTPIGSTKDARALVTSGEIAFVQMRYPQKIIVRSAKDLTISRGNHFADNIAGQARKASSAGIMHAPMRSRDSVYRRIENARRLQSHNSSDESWHLKRLLGGGGDDQVDAEWHANSVSWGRVGTKAARTFAKFDLRLTSIAFRQTAFAKAVSPSAGAPMGGCS